MAGRFTHIPQIAPLESRLMFSAALADLDQAQPIDLSPLESASVAGDLVASQDDLFRIVSPAKGKLDLLLSADGEGLDPYLEVFNQAGKRIRRNNNASRDTLDSHLRLRVRSGQVLYVRARCVGQTAGEYTLTVQPLPRDDFGNEVDTAREIRLRRDRRGGAARIDHADDTDVFAFTATRSGTLWVRMNAVRGQPVDTYVQLLDEQGNILASNDDAPGSLNAEVSFEVVARQRYHVAASSMGGTVGRYRLSLQIQPDQPQPQPQRPQALTGQDEALDDDVAPAEMLAVKLLEVDGRRELRVNGTIRPDRVTIQRDGDTVTVRGPSSPWSYDNIQAIRVYGFEGNDVFTIADGVDLPLTVWTGAGDDQVFACGAGPAQVHGGVGDDLIVALNGWTDLLDGGEGVDGLWGDADDVFEGVSQLELDLACVHAIAGFYQPYTSSAVLPGYVSMDIAGQDLVDPQAEYPYADLSPLDLFNNGPQYGDIAQGMLGDCYYLASLASLAQASPQRVEQLIAPLGDGTYAVRFYRGGEEVYLRIDADLPIYNQFYLAYAQTSLSGELWVPLLEKAYAYFRYGENSYESIEGGWMNPVLVELTNQPASWRSPRDLSSSDLFTYIQDALVAGKPVSAGTHAMAGGPVVGSHAYMVQSVQQIGSDRYVTFYNPWGVDGQPWDTHPEDGLVRLTMPQVANYFSRVIVGLA